MKFKHIIVVAFSLMLFIAVFAAAPATPIEINAINTRVYRSDLTAWVGNWEAPQAMYDQGAYVDDPVNWDDGLAKSAGSTWYNDNAGTGYGVFVIDMNQVRVMNFFSIFQMFSDGKTTDIQIYKNTNYMGNTKPLSTDAGWLAVTSKTAIGAGLDMSSYITNPTTISVGDFSSRYIKLHVYNDGSHGNISYIELKGIKGFYFNGSTYSENFLRGGPDSPTAIELTSFIAKNVDKGVQLTWRTESETENSGYIVERKVAAGEWVKLADYRNDASLVGQGTTSETNEYAYLDETVLPGTFRYRISDVDYQGKIKVHDAIEVTVTEENIELPKTFGLTAAYPNPFNPTLTIDYALDTDTDVMVGIYDLKGQLVNELEKAHKEAGYYQLQWQAHDVPSGVYVVKVVAGDKTDLRKVTLMK